MGKSLDLFYLKVKFLDLEVGHDYSVVIHSKTAEKYGLSSLDKVDLITKDGQEFTAELELSRSLVKKDEIGITVDVLGQLNLKQGEEIGLSLSHISHETLEAIRKKIKGKSIGKNEIKSIIGDISKGKLSKVLMTYYVASSFCYETSDEEIFLTAKAMADFGVKFTYPDGEIVADKHCIGGIPGNETTMIIVPTITSLGIKMPKNFSKAITSPAATGECVSVLMNIEFNKEQIEKIVKKVNGCLIWGGALDLAPADDKIIKVSAPLGLQNIGKVVASIMAKKYAMGITHSLIDIPVGPTAKVKDEQEARIWEKKFKYVGERLGMKVKVVFTDGSQPIGNGIGATLQVREVLRILQQKDNRAQDLEKKAMFLVASILENIGYAKGDDAINIAYEQLKSGASWKQMKKIIQVQGGNPEIDSENLSLGKITFDFIADRDGKVVNFDLKYLTFITRILGAPIDLKAGMFLYKKIGDEIKKGDKVFTLYTDSDFKLNLALKELEKKLFISF